MKKVTVRQVAQAMVDDTTPKITGKLWEKFDGIVYTCAIGGAALALDIDGQSLMTKLHKVDKDGVRMPSVILDTAWLQTLGPLIYRTNDDSHASKAAIGQAILDTADEETLNTVLNVRERRSRRKRI